jgi:membrane-anchored mycosin MYCP
LFRLPELWRSAGSRGAGIKLAVIDTGVSAHQLLAGRLIGAGDYVSDGDGAQDCDGHGTAVAGIAAAAQDSVTGFSGVAPGASVLAIRQTSVNYSAADSNNQNSVGDVNTLARAIVDAVHQGANVINMSVTSCLPAADAAHSPSAGQLQAALHFAMVSNVVVVAAAGNVGEGDCPQTPDNSTVVLPSWYDQDVLSVGAINQSRTVANFSYPGPWVDVAAPGESLMSLSLGGTGVTQWTHDLQDSSVDKPSPVQGTSFASPAVAGLAVLIRAKYPQLTARQVMDRITATASSSSSGSRDWGTGYGVVDPLAALNTQPAVLPPPVATASIEGELPIAPPAAASRGRTGALWGGVLGLFAVLATLALGIGKARSDPKRPKRPGSPAQPRSPRR